MKQLTRTAPSPVPAQPAPRPAGSVSPEDTQPISIEEYRAWQIERAKPRYATGEERAFRAVGYAGVSLPLGAITTGLGALAAGLHGAGVGAIVGLVLALLASAVGAATERPL